LRRALAIAAVACATLPATASAASFNVSTKATFEFSPASLGVAPGDTVVFHNADGGAHNVHFEDNQFQLPALPSAVWPDPVQRTFPTAGRFAYYCDQHGAPGGTGMSGVISVKAAGAGGPTLTPPAKVEALKAHHAKRGAIKVRLRASTAASARVTLARLSKGRYRKVKALKRNVGDKATSVTFRRQGGKPLKPGRYRVNVKLTDSNGNSGPSKSTKIRLR
jgi:plastocyanin